MISSGFSTKRDAYAQNENTTAVLDARQFRLLDDRGKIRATLSMEDYLPKLVLSNDELNTRLIATPGWIRISGEKSHVVMAVAPFASEKEAFIFLSQPKERKENVKVLLALEKGGDPRLTLLDESFLERVVLGRLEIRNKNTGSVEKRPLSSLALIDDKGKLTWTAP
jgi:hypothetical protein